MGLMDILNGMQNGPRGQKQPTPPGQSGGMSPIMMALLGLLAYKAMKGFGGGGAPAGSAARLRCHPARAPPKAAADSVTFSAACSADRAAAPDRAGCARRRRARRHPRRHARRRPAAAAA